MVKDFEKMIAEACKAYLYTREAPSYKERLESIGSVPESDAEIVTRFADNYDQLFKLQGLDPKKTWKRMYATLIRNNANDGKARCVYLQGAVSAGKSSLINLLSCVYQQYEIGSFGPQAIHSRFWLDNLYGKEIYIGDEAQADESNIQTYLLLLEGNPSNKTEVKYGDKVTLEPKPVIMACNIDIYDRCPARKEAIRQRITPVRFTRQCPKYLNLRPEPRLLPYVLRTLLERHLDPITDTSKAKIGNYLFIHLRVTLYFVVAQHNLNDCCFVYFIAEANAKFDEMLKRAGIPQDVIAMETEDISKPLELCEDISDAEQPSPKLVDYSDDSDDESCENVAPPPRQPTIDELFARELENARLVNDFMAKYRTDIELD